MLGGSDELMSEMARDKIDEIPTPYYSMPVVPEEYANLPDRIAESFKGKVLFVSGGSGFLGKVLIEKILRKSPSVGHIYLLMRPKKGKEGKQRLDEVFASPLYDELRKLRGPKVFEKVSAIAGDVMELELGMSKEDRAMLAEKVDIVIHAAATIRFDEPLKKAVLLNTRGTKLMLELAKTMKKLKMFAHISTAYCHLDQKLLEEKMYPPATDPHKIIKSCELMEQDLVDSVSEKILKGFPNSYSFTKNLSEGLVNEQIEQGMPCMILRPSIVIPVWLEPLAGWTDNINGPTGLLIGAGKGVIRTMHCDNTGYADFIPVDVCVNGILLAIWNFTGRGDKGRNVCHLTSSSEWKVTWQEIIDIGKEIIITEVPLNNAVWYPGGSMKKSRFIHNLCVLFFHLIPAYFLDTIIFLSGHKPLLVRIQDRISKGFEIFEYYANNQWDFQNEQVKLLRLILNEREKIEYNIIGDSMDIKKYFRDCILAARLYILKETPDTIPAARRHMRIMFWVDVIAQIAFYSFLLWFMYNWSGVFLRFFVSLLRLAEHVLTFFTSDSSVVTPVSHDL